MAKIEMNRLNLNEIGSDKEFDEIDRTMIMDIKNKIDSYGKKNSDEEINKIIKRLNKYEEVDKVSANAWKKGELIFWNDIEAQLTSIELKNLVKLNRTKGNQCFDVYVVPSGKTPSRSIKEGEKNSKWTSRGGAALSEKNFPRTTAGRGDVIILTYNSSPKENRLAHEFGHILLTKGNAHEGKKEKDLMHENSKGGIYLDKVECSIINYRINNF